MSGQFITVKNPCTAISCYHICTCPTSLISMTAIFASQAWLLYYGVFDPRTGWPSGKVKPTLVTLNVGHILSGDQNHSCLQHRRSGYGWSPKKTCFCFGVYRCSGNWALKRVLVPKWETHTFETNKHMHVHAKLDPCL